MSEYKLVPVEPTERQVVAAVKAVLQCTLSEAESSHEFDIVYRESKEVYSAMLAAAPAVQGEPVGYVSQDFLEGKWSLDHIAKSDEGQISRTIPVLAKPPQPAEQKPSADDSLTPVPDELFAAEFAAWWEEHGQFCRAGGGTYEQSFAFEAWRHLYPKLVKLQKVAAEQQPDVTKLSREALAELIHGMAVSVDVSTGESDFGNRYFGVVDEVQWNANERHGMMLLVQEPEANFTTPVSPDVSGLVEALEGVLDGRPLDTEFWDRCEEFIAAHRKGDET